MEADFRGTGSPNTKDLPGFAGQKITKAARSPRSRAVPGGPAAALSGAYADRSKRSGHLREEQRSGLKFSWLSDRWRFTGNGLLLFGDSVILGFLRLGLFLVEKCDLHGAVGGRAKCQVLLLPRGELFCFLNTEFYNALAIASSAAL